MKRRFFAIFSLLALTTGPALADACVKLRAGASYACKKFSPAEKREAANYGLQLGVSFEANKRTLLKHGWALDKHSLDDDGADPSNGREMSCGSGWDAVCQAAFEKDKLVLVLTLSAVNEGTPLVAVEAAERAASAAEFARTLTTPSFIIRIEVHCGEGNVTCDDVTYIGTSKKTGESIKLRGKTKHSMCADRVTPCGFQGYEFWNGQTCYRVLENGDLSVTRQNKVLVQERGRWK